MISWTKVEKKKGQFYKKVIFCAVLCIIVGLGMHSIALVELGSVMLVGGIIVLCAVGRSEYAFDHIHRCGSCGVIMKE